MTPYTITANYEHVFNLPGGSTLSARIDGEYEAAHLSYELASAVVGRWVSSSTCTVGGRTIGNLSANWASSGGRYAISAYVRNFTNDAIHHLRREDTIRPSSIVTWTDPRMYGASASVRF